MKDLEERVYKFQTGELPGQPMSMHMGTSYLVNDLWKEVKRLRKIKVAATEIINAKTQAKRNIALDELAKELAND